MRRNSQRFQMTNRIPINQRQMDQDRETNHRLNRQAPQFVGIGESRQDRTRMRRSFPQTDPRQGPGMITKIKSGISQGYKIISEKLSNSLYSLVSGQDNEPPIPEGLSDLSDDEILSKVGEFPHNDKVTPNTFQRLCNKCQRE